MWSCSRPLGMFFFPIRGMYASQSEASSRPSSSRRLLWVPSSSSSGAEYPWILEEPPFQSLYRIHWFPGSQLVEQRSQHIHLVPPEGCSCFLLLQPTPWLQFTASLVLPSYILESSMEPKGCRKLSFWIQELASISLGRF